jgi:hypothetical protein
VDGRPVSGVTTRFLSWCWEKLAQKGKKVWVLIWDNAPWHISRAVRRWLGKHNREVKKSGSEAGVRIVSCLLPKKSPWLNAMEPKWVHAASAKSSSPRVCWALRSLPTGFAGFSAVRTTSIYPFPRRSPDHALANPSYLERRLVGSGVSILRFELWPGLHAEASPHLLVERRDARVAELTPLDFGSRCALRRPAHLPCAVLQCGYFRRERPLELGTHRGVGVLQLIRVLG